MNVRLLFRFWFLVLFLFACAPAPTPAPEPKILNVYATAAARPWLPGVYDCALPDLIIQLSDESAADMVLRIGEPEILSMPVYQIDEEELLIVTSRQSVVANMTLEQVRILFAGVDSPPVQIWVYAEGEDVQELFEQAVMEGRSVTSFARLAVSPQHMSDVLNAEPNAVGILPRHWKMGNPREVYSIGTFPVLAILKAEPQGALLNLLACLQN
ncbi:MAG: hypothetical protein Kow002_15260 [Anaerolineales bacterium]